MGRSTAAGTMTRRRVYLFLVVIVAVLVSLALWSISGESTVDVKLAWDRNPNPKVAGYKIYFSRSNWEHATVIDVGNRTEYTVKGLDAGVTYRFAATAYSRTGEESALSHEVVYPPAGSPSEASSSAAPGTHR